jgi:hypothetical protein
MRYLLLLMVLPAFSQQPPDPVPSDANLNTAVGRQSLSSLSLSSGLPYSYGNTGVGALALYQNTTGSTNTALGAQSLYSNNTGEYNTAVGATALYSNTTGNQNTACGLQALAYNSTGYENSALGESALYSNTTGTHNTAVGEAALSANTTGSNNIALGQNAGSAVTTGYRNIEIGNPGYVTDSAVIRIGTTQTATYIAGVRTATVSGNAVYVSANGQLGISTEASAANLQAQIIVMQAQINQLKAKLGIK